MYIKNENEPRLIHETRVFQFFKFWSSSNEGHHRRRFWHATLRLCSAIRRHHPPQRAVLSQICCFGERNVVLFQILLDGAEPRDAG